MQPEVKKIVNFDQFFNIEAKSPIPKSPEPKPQNIGFPNFGVKAEQSAKGTNNKEDFAFFDDFFDKKK